MIALSRCCALGHDRHEHQHEHEHRHADSRQVVDFLRLARPCRRRRARPGRSVVSAARAVSLRHQRRSMPAASNRRFAISSFSVVASQSGSRAYDVCLGVVAASVGLRAPASRTSAGISTNANESSCLDLRPTTRPSTSSAERPAGSTRFGRKCGPFAASPLPDFWLCSPAACASGVVQHAGAVDDGERRDRRVDVPLGVAHEDDERRPSAPAS